MNKVFEGKCGECSFGTTTLAGNRLCEFDREVREHASDCEIIRTDLPGHIQKIVKAKTLGELAEKEFEKFTDFIKQEFGYKVADRIGGEGWINVVIDLLKQKKKKNNFLRGGKTMFESEIEKQLREAREEERERFYSVLKQLNDIIAERLECLFYILARDNITKAYLKGAIREVSAMLKEFKKELAINKNTGKGLYSNEKLAMFARKLVSKFMESENNTTRDVIGLKEEIIRKARKLKNLAYYMSLPYKIEYKKIIKEEGGYWLAYIPQLGRYAFIGDGETKEEALKSLNFIKVELFKDYLKEGINIPEPE